MGLRRAALVVLSALACAVPSTASASATILVKFTRPASAPAQVAAFGDDLVRETAGDVAVVDPAPGQSVADALAAYRARADVAYAEPNRIRFLSALSPPNDPGFSAQWAFSTIDAMGGWSLFPGTFMPAAGAPLAVVDTGVDATHEDLAGRISPTLSATCLGGGCSAGAPTDPVGHGTHVAGIAGAATDNGLGVAGVAFASPIIAVRVFHDDPTYGWIADDSDVADGISWAAQHGAKAINLSLGGTGYSLTLCNAVDVAVNAYHAVVVAAAGNSSVATPSYPASCPGAIGVAATDSSDLPASFSNYGSPNVVVSAPGAGILSTIPGNAYASYSGTSMASPFVTGLAALMVTLHPGIAVSAVRQVLASSSDKVGALAYGTDPYGTCAGCTWEPHYGYGRINVQRAIAATVPPPPPPLPRPPPPPPPPPPAAAADTRAPVVRAFAARGRRGQKLRLRYRVGDDKGETTERITVYRKTRVLRRFTRPLRQTSNAVTYWLPWRAGKPGAYRFCVRATDLAGNRSRLACAAVRVR